MSLTHKLFFSMLMLELEVFLHPMTSWSTCKKCWVIVASWEKGPAACVELSWTRSWNTARLAALLEQTEYQRTKNGTSLLLFFPFVSMVPEPVRACFVWWNGPSCQ